MSTKTLGRKIAKVVAFALMAVTVFVGGLATSKILQKEEMAQVGNVQTDNSLQAQQTINNGISLMAADGSGYVGNTLGQSVPYGALKVTATVSPATAKNQTLSWSCAWAGTTSSWSSGKTVEDYFSLSTSGANAHEVYLWAKQPFGDQITVTATSTDGGNKSATMTVDFAKRMTAATISKQEGLTGVFDYPSSIYYDNFLKTSYDIDPIGVVEYTPTFGVGTKDLTWSLYDCVITYDEDYMSMVEGGGFVHSEGGGTNYAETSGTWCYRQDRGFESFAYNVFSRDDAHYLFFDGSAGNEANIYKLQQIIRDVDGYLGCMELQFRSTEKDSLGNVYSFTMSFDLYVSVSLLEVTVENVNLSDSSLTM